jgi:hypothetical protein
MTYGATNQWRTNMQNGIEITAAMATMAQLMSIRHVFDDSLQSRGAGVLQYILAIGDGRYLAWQDDDTDEMVVSPLGLWDESNLADVIDDSVPMWFVHEGETPCCEQ